MWHAVWLGLGASRASRGICAFPLGLGASRAAVVAPFSSGLGPAERLLLRLSLRAWGQQSGCCCAFLLGLGASEALNHCVWLGYVWLALSLAAALAQVPNTSDRCSQHDPLRCCCCVRCCCCQLHGRQRRSAVVPDLAGRCYQVYSSIIRYSTYNICIIPSLIILY